MRVGELLALLLNKDNDPSFLDRKVVNRGFVECGFVDVKGVEEIELFTKHEPGFAEYDEWEELERINKSRRESRVDGIKLKPLKRKKILAVEII